MAKKDFTKATQNVANKFFTTNENDSDNVINDYNITNDMNNDKHTYITKDENVSKYLNSTKHSKNSNVTNKSKHYDERGKRSERFGILLDTKLKEDLKDLANATGSKSVNDFIVTILIDFVEKDENQKKLEMYKKILKG